MLSFTSHDFKKIRGILPAGSVGGDVSLMHVGQKWCSLRGPTQFFGNFFICGPIRTKFAQYI